MEIKCISCGIIKSITEFYKSKNSKDGMRHTCKNCMKLSARNYNRSDEAKFMAIERDKNKWRDSPERMLLSNARFRAKKNNIEFSLNRDDIVIPNVCPVLGIPIIIGSGKVNYNSPSIDRIDSSKGYTKKNSRIISWRANVVKSDASLDELVMILSYMMQKGLSSEKM